MTAARTVVVLDRDETAGATLCAMLENAGHRVLAAASAAAVLTVLSKRQVDVVLTNLLFGVFGREAPLLETIRAVQPGTAIVLTTRWEGPADEPPPYDAILPKAFSMHDLGEVVATVRRRH